MSIAGLLSTSCGSAPDLPATFDIVYRTRANGVQVPIFELTLRSNGSAELDCREHCAVPGIARIQVPDGTMRGLSYVLRDSGFFRLPRTVNQPNPVVHHDQSSVTYRDGHQIHEVVGPDRVRALVDWITNAVDVRFWVTPSVELYERHMKDGWRPHLDPGSALQLAIEAGDLRAVRFLLHHRSPIAAVPVYALARTTNQDMLDLVLEAAQIDMTSETYRALLHSAVRNTNLPLARRLVAMGADVKAVDPSGITPLEIAIGNGSWALITLVLDHGADPNAVDRRGRSMLWLAAESYNTAGITLLAKHGAVVDARDAGGMTALMHAAELCRAWSVRALLDAGADPALRDSRGRHAADLRLPLGDSNASKCLESQPLLR